MKNIIAIYRRELGSYFVSPIAYAVIGVFLIIAGLMFYYGTFGQEGLLNRVITYRMRMMQSGGAGDVDVPSIIMQQLMSFAATVSLFMVPMLTMGSYAEERKRGTMEMLMTSPLTEWQIVLSKFFTGLTLYVLMIVPTLVFNVYIAKFSDPSFPWRIMWSSYLGLVLLGAVLIALGLFISSLTENQIVAGVITFAIALLLWIISMLANDTSTAWGQALQYLSVIQHYEGFTRGVIDTTSLVFYLTLTALGLFLTWQSLNSMRWRRA